MGWASLPAGLFSCAPALGEFWVNPLPDFKCFLKQGPKPPRCDDRRQARVDHAHVRCCADWRKPVVVLALFVATFVNDTAVLSNAR